MSSTRRVIERRVRRGAPWSEREDDRLLHIAHLPPVVVARLMQRSWHACRRRLHYLRANGPGQPPSHKGPGRNG